MIAYYIHWNYPSSADRKLYDYGKDDKHLFHSEYNAGTFAKNKLAEISKNIKRAEYLIDKHYSSNITDNEKKELNNLIKYLRNDTPDSYSIRERDIVFEDENKE